MKLWQRYIECLLTLAIFEEAEPSSSNAISPALLKATEHLRPLVMLAPENRAYRLRLIQLYQQAIEQLLAANRAADADRVWRFMNEKLIGRLDKADQQPDAIRVRLMAERQGVLIAVGLQDFELARQRFEKAIEAWRTQRGSLDDGSKSMKRMDEDWTNLERMIESLPR